MNTPTSHVSEAPYWPYLAAAAVLTDFAAQELRPLGSGKPDLSAVGEMLMEHGEPIRNGPAKGRWSLSGTSRHAALVELKRQGALADALRANRHHHAPDNATQQAIDSLAGGGELSLGNKSLTDLLGLERAVEFLSPVIDTPAELRSQLLARIERLRLLEPLQRLLAHGFAGRSKEMTELRSHVDQLASKSYTELISRGIDRVIDVFRHRPPLVIWGPGGVGKSTLIAKFLVDHCGPELIKPTPFVYLDFDRGQLDPLQPDSLLTEAFRQIEAQFPEFAREAAGLAVDGAARLVVEDPEDISRSEHYGRSEALRKRFIELINRIGQSHDSHVLLFIDTFEMVQRRGSTPVFNVLTLAARLTSGSPRLRVVIAGRIALRDADFPYADALPRWKPLPLEGFDKEAGRACLLGRLNKLGLDAVGSRVLDRIVSLVRGNPLSLRLAAQVFARRGVKAVEDVVELALFDEAFTQERLQGFLHRRIVENLEEPVRKLADPGLVVRRITPEVIVSVLAKPCQLDVATLADAETLFAKLQNEVALVQPFDNVTVRHRSDVRVLMLPLLRKKLGDKARAIDQAAVAYWAGQEGAVARAEEVYHLAWLGCDKRKLDACWERGPIQTALFEETLDEFEALGIAPDIRIWLCVKLEREISPELEFEAGRAEWELHAERRARSLLASGAAEEALKSLRARSDDRTAASPLWLLELEALKLLGRDEEALLGVTRALAAAADGHATGQIAVLLLHQASLFERASRWGDASACTNRAAEIAAALDDEVLLFEAKLAQTRLARTMGANTLPALQRELAALVDEPEVADALKRRPALLREASAEVGDLRPELFIMSAELLGAGSSDSRAEALRLINLGVAHAQREDHQAAIEPLRRAGAIASGIHDADLQALALVQLGGVLVDKARLDEAEACFRQALDLALAEQNTDLVVQARGGLGNVHVSAGDLEGAMQDYEASLALARDIADPANRNNAVGAALGNLANVHLARGDLDRALELLHDNHRLAQASGNRHGERQALSSLANVYGLMGDHAKAIDLSLRTLEMARALRDVRGEAAILCNLGSLYTQLDRWDEARHTLERAVQISRQIADRATEAKALGNLGVMYLRTGELDQSRAHCTQQFEIGRVLQDHLTMGLALYNLALVQDAAGEAGEAHTIMQHVVEISPPGSAVVRQALAWLDSGVGEHSSSVRHEVRQGRYDQLRESVESTRVSSRAFLVQKLKRS